MLEFQTPEIMLPTLDHFIYFFFSYAKTLGLICCSLYQWHRWCHIILKIWVFL